MRVRGAQERNLQRVTNMRSISSKKHPPHAKRRRTSLLHAIGTNICDAILARLRVSGEDLLIPHRLALDVFFARQAWGIAVGDAPEAGFGHAGG